MINYRVTFPEHYGIGSQGHRDASSRQGHYIHAQGRVDARLTINHLFEARNVRVIDVQEEDPNQPWERTPVAFTLYSWVE